MNHFADDAETRRRDRLALDAIEALDPRRLLDVVRSESISMCGVTGAVVVMETLRRLGHLTRCEPVGYQTSVDTTGDRKPRRRLRGDVVRLTTHAGCVATHHETTSPVPSRR